MKLYQYKIFIFFLFLGIPQIISAQNTLIGNQRASDLVRQASALLYNMEPQRADSVIDQVELILPNHPINPVLRAFNTRWANMPPDFESPEFKMHFEYLMESLDLADSILDENEEDPEGVFFALATHSLLAQYYSEQGSYWKALSSAQSAYKLIKQGFDKMDLYDEFYFSTGVYNYYREKYPETYPFYKSFMWIFKSGDIEQGLVQLEKASEICLLSRIEARYYLHFIYLYYEGNDPKARLYAKKLIEEFPNNIFFKAIYCETMLLSRNFSIVEKDLNEFKNHPKPFYKFLGYLFSGWVQEEAYGELAKAESDYLRSLELSEEVGLKIDHYLSLIYSGLGSVHARQQNSEEAENYYKLALKYANFPRLEEEPRQYLDR